jgi:protein involved in polysaccharide export with SLBB domain
LKRALLLVLFLALATRAFAQDSSSRDEDETRNTTPPAASLKDVNPSLPLELSGPIDATRYRLGAGDVLSLELSGRASRVVILQVDPEGRVNVPELGVVTVGGRTLAEVRTDVIGRLRRIYSGVRIDLRPVRLRTFKVYVAGQVKAPGSAVTNGGQRASEVFVGSLALLPDASHRNIELRRRDGSRLRVDLDAFALVGNDQDNPFLEDGDVLVVPPRVERVYALGAFGRPGEYEYAPGDSLSDLVALAGGLLPGSEPTGTLVRFSNQAVTESLSVRLDAPGGPLLQGEDRLFSRRASEYMRTRNVNLVGEVRFPGPYSLVEGQDRISTLIARAGGLTPYAASDRIQIFRPSAVAGGQRDIEFERLSRLSRSEMTDAEYQVFKTKLASQQSAFVVSMEQLAQPGGTYDVTARDGDVIVIERETEAVRVAGEVRRPSLVEFDPARSGKEYIELAGGFSNRANRGKVRVTHAGSNQTLLLQDVKSIQPGDFIWVPERSDTSFWSVFKDLITVAGAVATIIVLVDPTR